MKKNKICNLTVNRSTPVQSEAGVFDLKESDRKKLVSLLTVTDHDASSTIDCRRRVAGIIGLIPSGTDAVMIDGYLPLMVELVSKLSILKIPTCTPYRHRYFIPN